MGFTNEYKRRVSCAMSFFRRRRKSANTIDAGTVITGEIRSENNWTLSGTLVGDLVALGDVMIDKGAEIRGNVSGENVWVAGKVIGNIEARKHLHLASSSYITGDTSYQTLRIEEGAFFTGKMELADDHAAAETPESEVPVRKVPDAAPVQSQYAIAPPQAEPAFPTRNKRVVIS